MPIAPGSRVGVYEVGELIGEGGMGAVYRARDSRLERDVAIKVIRPELAADPDRARFDREARSWRRSTIRTSPPSMGSNRQATRAC